MAATKYPRDLAVRVLTRVLSEHEPLDEALTQLGVGLDAPTRAWLQEVCSGTLRWRGRLDQAIDSVALKKKPSGWLRKALLIAAYQLIAQERTSPAAVVSETVSEIKRKEGPAPAAFANAALRKIAEHAVSWRALELRAGAPSLEQAAWASLPEWLWRRLVAAHGLEWAKAYALASLERPVTWIRAREPEGFAPDWAEAGPVAGAYRLTRGGAITEREGFGEGKLIVQDISSQRLVAAVTERVGALGSALDLCAAPGGKSVGLLWSGFEQVHASDRDPARYELLRSTLERVQGGDRIQVVERSAVSGLPPQDLVWVDAPCSGTGILRRHPDVRWLRREAELEGLRGVQAQLLDEAWARVRPGGYLAYSVCSVLKEEGPDAVQALMTRTAGAERVGEWFFTPQESPFFGDGFWCALLHNKMSPA